MNRSHKIKICHIVNVITGKTDGVFNHIKSLVMNLDPSKYEHILVYQGGDFVRQEAEKLQIKVYEIKEFSKKFSFFVIKKIAEIAKEEKVDILHSHVVKPYLFTGLANFFLNKKHIFNFHGLFILNNVYYNELEKILMFGVHILITIFKKIDLAVVPSKNSKSILLNETKLFPKILHYYNGFVPLYEETLTGKKKNLSNKDGKKFCVGIVARLDTEKRLDRAFRIIKKISEVRTDFEVVIYGDGPLEDKLKILAIELKINDLVKFKGFTQDIINKYKEFDLLFYSSDSEGLPLSIFEAMANGVPIISTDVGGIKEVLLENNCGLVYDKENIDQAVKYILDLMNNEELRSIMSKNAIDAIKNFYTIENFTNTFDKIYSELMNERKN